MAHPRPAASFTSAKCSGTGPEMSCPCPNCLASSRRCVRPVCPAFSRNASPGLLIRAPCADAAGTLKDSGLLRRAKTIMERQGAQLGQISPRGRAEMRGLGTRFAEGFLLSRRPAATELPTDDAEELPGTATVSDHGPECTVRGRVEATGKPRVLDSRDEFLGVCAGCGAPHPTTGAIAPHATGCLRCSGVGGHPRRGGAETWSRRGHAPRVPRRPVGLLLPAVLRHLPQLQCPTDWRGAGIERGRGGSPLPPLAAAPR